MNKLKINMNLNYLKIMTKLINKNKVIMKNNKKILFN